MFRVLVIGLMSLLLYGCAHKDSSINKATLKLDNSNIKQHNTHKYSKKCMEVCRVLCSEYNQFLSLNDIFICFNKQQINFCHIENIICNKDLNTCHANRMHMQCISSVLYADRDLIICTHDNKLSMYHVHDQSSTSALMSDVVLKCERVHDFIFIFIDSKQDCYSRKFHIYDMTTKRLIEHDIGVDFLAFGHFQNKIAFVTAEQSYIVFDIAQYIHSRNISSLKQIEYHHDIPNDEVKVLYNHLSVSDATLISYGNIVEFLVDQPYIQRISIPNTCVYGLNQIIACSDRAYLILNNLIFNLPDISNPTNVNDVILDIKTTKNSIVIVGKKNIMITNNEYVQSKKCYAQIKNNEYKVSISNNYLFVYDNYHGYIYDILTGDKLCQVPINRRITFAQMYDNCLVLVDGDELKGYQIIDYPNDDLNSRL
jgi:hypothetical protein